MGIQRDIKIPTTKLEGYCMHFHDPTLFQYNQSSMIGKATKAQHSNQGQHAAIGYNHACMHGYRWM